MMDSLGDYLDHVKVATPGTYSVHKDECICSFDTPESEGGLYVCMKTFDALGVEFLDYYFERYGYRVYLHIKRMKYRVDRPGTSDNKPKRLAIGLEGGFDVDEKEFRYEDIISIVLMPSRNEIPLPNADLPDLVLQSVNSILTLESSESLRERQQTSVWGGEQRQVSKFAENLEQITPAPQIPPSGWKCEECDLTENLWLNLTDGSILCGRRFFDGSGGNNHALEHFKKFKRPLAVKLGTISSDSSADVYSYPEEDMVLDPLLDKHLAHFGIDAHAMNKTEKSMIELEIDINQKFGEWKTIQEEGQELEPAAGPEFTGLDNLGNSCYMNCVLQILFSLKEFQGRFYPPVPVYNLCDGPSDFNHQMAKLAYGLLSGRYSSLEQSSVDQSVRNSIAPKSFKHYVCGQNSNFATKRQQDAQEFFLFLLDLVERNNNDGRTLKSPCKVFEFVLEDRLECSTSKKVKYTHRIDFCLPLHVDLTRSLNPKEVEEYQLKKNKEENKDIPIVRHKLSLKNCLQQFCENELVKDFYSPAIRGYTTAQKHTKIARFPRYFVFQIKKFQLGTDWIPRKLDIALEVPDQLDLEMLSAQGPQPGEEELEPSSSDNDIVQNKSNESDEIIWNDQQNITTNNKDLENLQKARRNENDLFEPDFAAMATLLSMGIDEIDAKNALSKCNNDPQQAIEFIFNPPSSAASVGSGAGSCATGASMQTSIVPYESTSTSSNAELETEKNADISRLQIFKANEESMALLLSMGIDEKRAINALRETDNDPARAIDHIFGSNSCSDSAPQQQQYGPQQQQPASSSSASFGTEIKPSPSSIVTGSDAFKMKIFRPDSAPKKYQLKAFISHMGTSTMCGHYVCHIMKNGRWYIFNDNKVAVSENPPKELGYLYFYERCDSTPASTDKDSPSHQTQSASAGGSSA